jgi:hypothetical protein
MPEYFFVTAMAATIGTARSRPCATLDNAFSGANLLSNGAGSVWIVGSDDSVVLTTEQVRLRLKQSMLSRVAAEHVTTIAQTATTPMPHGRGGAGTCPLGVLMR